ncbi:MAG: Cu(I)/Ag(I) efflux system membrane protein CusA, partial [bacterium]
RQDRIIRSFPEVARVHGKAGRADTSTDPAPLSMIETTIVLKPREEWRPRTRWYTGRLPSFLAGVVRPIWPDRISREDLISEMDQALRFPGVTNAWTMPIKARIDMLSTGVRTPVGIKVFGSDLAVIESIGARIEAVVREVPGTRSVFAERAAGGWFLDIEPDREALARHGLTIESFQMTIAAAVGGENVTTVLDGRARYPVNVRYPRELRQDPDAIARILVATPAGAQVPMGSLATIRVVTGPSMIRNESGFLAGYVYVDVTDRDIGGYVDEARKKVREQVELPAGYSLQWSGQYENMQRVADRLRLIVPITLLLIAGLLYLNTRSMFKTLLILVAVPFSAIGAIWLFHLLHYNVSIAAWVGMIALLGLDAETAVFMLLFLDLSWKEARAAGRLNS